MRSRVRVFVCVVFCVCLFFASVVPSERRAVYGQEKRQLTRSYSRSTEKEGGGSGGRSGADGIAEA